MTHTGAPGTRYRRSVGTALLVLGLGLSVAQCDYALKPDKEVEEEVPAPDPPPPAPDLQATLADPGDCAALPPPRRYHHMAAFFSESANSVIAVDGAEHTVQRGFVVHGGLAPDGTVLNDLWVYDLGYVGGCRWVLVSEAALPEGGAYGGGFAFDWNGSFYLVGGYRESAGEIAAGSAVDRLALGNLAAGFVPHSSLDRGPYAFTRSAAELCVDPIYSCPTAIDLELDTLIPDALQGIESGSFTCPDFGGTQSSYSYVCQGQDPPVAGICPGVSVTNGLGDTAVLDWPAVGGLLRGCRDDPICTDGVDEAIDLVAAPGLAEVAMAMDPLSGEATVHGGTTGCRGSCAAWSELEGRSLVGAQWLAAANSDEVIGGVGTSATTALGEQFAAHEPAGWPGSSSFGVRAGAAVRLGPEWSHVDREWTGSAGPVVLVGGTTHQGLPAAWRWELICESQQYGCSSDCFDGEWVEEGLSDLPEASLGPPFAVWDGSGHDPLALTASVEGRYGAAAVGVGGNRMLVVGGRTAQHPDGSPEVLHLEYVPGGTSAASSVSTGSANNTPTQHPARHGAGLAFDPVSRTTYIFGGTDDSLVWAVTGPETLTPNQHSRFSASGVGVDLFWNEATSRWDVSVGFTLEHTCDQGSECFGDRVVLFLMTDDEDELEASQVYGARRIESSSGGGLTPGRYALDRLMTDTDSQEVLVTLSVEERPTNDLHVAANDDYGFHAGPHGEPPNEGVFAYLRGLPVWVEPRGTSEVDEPFTSYYASFLEPQPVEVIRVTVDQSVQVVMPGEPHFSCDGDDLDVHFAFGAVPSSSQTSTCSWDVTERPWAFWMYASPDVTPLSSVQANGAAIGVWIDDGLAAATRAAVFDHVLVEMQGDLEFLQERLGVLGGVDHLVFVRPTPTEGSSFRGRGGGMFVRAFQANGDLHAGGDFRATTVHEMAHRWFGGRREAAADARWVEEGMPTLLAIMRYPLGPHRSRQLFEGLVRMGRTATDPGLTADLETDSHVDSVVYDLGAYTLAQLHATLRGRDPLKTHADIWAEWRDFLSVGDPGNQFAASDVEAFLQSLWLEPGPAGSSSFYAEWIETGRVGTPLLGIREFEYGGPGPTDVRWVEVHQAQVDELGWPVFTDVPYQLACDSLPELGKRSFAECQRGWELEVAPPGLLGSRSAGAGSAVERIDLTPNPALNDPAAAMPSFLALISNQMLLPESIAYGDVLGGQPRGGGEEPPAETWLWRCSPLGMPHPRCDLTQNDADLDGYATLEDCDDLDASVHPDADQTPWAFTAQPVDDENCDGWPSTAFWGTP